MAFTQNQKIKLHIGCGMKYLAGYKHADIQSFEHVDYVTPANNLHMLEDDSVAEIYACHILEHFGRHEIADVLKEWNRVLEPNGTLRIAVPNFKAITEEYINGTNIEKLMGLLYGGQDYKFNFHYQAFDFERLEELLSNSGFSRIATYNWQDFLPEEFDDFSRAYLPHMDIENGRLMSLNVLAYKG